MTQLATTPAPRLQQAPPDRTGRRRRHRYTRAVAVFVVPFGVLFLLFYLVPIGYAIVQSLYVVKRTGTYGPAQEVFGGLAQYQLVFTDGPFWTSVARMLLYGVIQVPIMLGLALALALLLDSGLVTGRRFFRLAFFVPYAVPGVVAAIMWGFLYSPNLSPLKPITSTVDLLSADTVLWSIANVVTWVYVGYNMLIIYSALMSIPTEMYEAARLDGAGRLRIAWSIKIPLVMPAIVLTTVFSIIGTLQLLSEPQVFRSFSSAVSSTYTPNMTVFSLSAVPNFNLAAAFSVVLALTTFVLSFAFLKATQRRSLP
ncbi:sugar ABC transporter permease [Catellatospora sp. IY07-71]|uniref:carbohydrate ABC transporter permease n=1 Tax=Catellatospora sp. IY07-71 TaxID=2728827 RepID=UPI001BB30625|nr:sugar ABC transporter permease [Catellatospora sp. IY07-71]BCJ75915.1 sugar ABC transporter permease [Catellatospora sp. IY07-71]